MRPMLLPLLAVANISNASHDMGLISLVLESNDRFDIVSHSRGSCSKSKLRSCEPVDAVTLSSQGASHGRSSFTKQPVHIGFVASEQWAGLGSAPSGVTPITVPPRLKRTTATVRLGRGFAQSSWAFGFVAIRPPAKAAVLEYCST